MSLTDDARPDDIRAMLLAMQQTIDQHGELLEKLTGFMSENRPTFKEIVEAVAEFYDITKDDLVSPSRARTHSHPRKVVYYLARKLTRLSLNGIAQRLGGRDHGTIYAGFQQMAMRVRRDEILRDDIDVLRSRIAEKVLLRPGSVPS